MYHEKFAINRNSVSTSRTVFNRCSLVCRTVSERTKQRLRRTNREREGSQEFEHGPALFLPRCPPFAPPLHCRPFPAVRSLSSPPRTSPSSVLRRAGPHRTCRPVALNRAAAEGARARVKVSCIGRSRARRGRSCHVPVNSLTTLTTRIPRGRRGLVDNWRRASKLLLSQYIIQTRVGTSRHADSPRLIGLIAREACFGRSGRP